MLLYEDHNAHEEHKGIVHALAFAPDGSTLASGGKDGAVYLRDGLGEPVSLLEHAAEYPSGLLARLHARRRHHRRRRVRLARLSAGRVGQARRVRPDDDCPDHGRGHPRRSHAGGRHGRAREAHDWVIRIVGLRSRPPPRTALPGAERRPRGRCVPRTADGRLGHRAPQGLRVGRAQARPVRVPSAEELPRHRPQRRTAGDWWSRWTTRRRSTTSPSGWNSSS